MPADRRATRRYSFGGSNTLQLQIERGAPADLFLSAGPKEAQALYREGRCERPLHLRDEHARAHRARRATPRRCGSVYGLRKGGLKLSIGNASVPIGDYTRRLLRRLRLSRVLETNTRLPAVQRRPGPVAGGLRRRRRRLRLRDRRPHAARPRRPAVRAAVGAAARPLPGLRRPAQRRRTRSALAPARTLRSTRGRRRCAASASACRRAADGRARVGALAVGLVVAFLGLPVVALLAEAPLERRAVAAGAPGRPGRAVGDAQDEPRRERPHPRRRHAGRVGARDAALPRPRARS